MAVAIPFIVLSPAIVQAGPLVALATRRNRSRPTLWVAGGCLVSILGDIVGRIAAHRVGNNYWVSAIDDPAMFSCFLIALVDWQVTYIERLAFRIAIFFFLATYVVLVWLVEDVSGFSRFGVPMYTLALLAAAVWTFQRRALQPGRHAVPSADWAWVTGGLALYGATRLVTEAFAAPLLAAQRIDLFTRVWEVRAILVDLVFIALTLGALRPPVSPEPTP